MIRIICEKCKNAYLQKEGAELSCPNCKAVYPETEENFLSGTQYYNEGKLSEASDCLMKYIVKNGAEPRAIFYKALCDGFDYDEDTTSLADVYAKIIQSLSELSDDLFVKYLATANDEAEKLENLVAEAHIRLFEDADAEKIKKEVTAIIKLRDEAIAFRNELTKLADGYNERATDKISVRFSNCALVKPALATEVGELRFNKIVENIASHTVFTGILSTDIKNLEIYYRCIVMFFETNRQKYDFLLSTAGKFEQLDKLLEEGSYTAIKGVTTIANKIKNAAYDFFQDSLKDHDDEFEQQTETVVVIASEVVEEEIAVEIEETAEEEKSEPEFEDIYSSSDAEEMPEDNGEPVAEPEEKAEEEETSCEALDDAVVEIATVEPEEEAAVEAADEETVVLIDEVVDGADEPAEEAVPADGEAGAEELCVEASEAEVSTEAHTEEETAEESPAEAPSTVLEAITRNGTIPDDSKDDAEENADTSDEEPLTDGTNTPKTKHKKNYAPFIAVILVVLAVIGLIALKIVPAKLNEKNYAQAQALESAKKYGEAAVVYAELGDYEDALEKAKLCSYNNALELEKAGKFTEAKEIYSSLGNYNDSAAKATSCTYNEALAILDAGKYDEAAKIFEGLGDYLDSKTKIAECTYKKALDLTAAKDYEGAIELLNTIPDYVGSEDALLNAKYGYVNANLDAENETTLIYLKELAKAKYKDSIDIKNKLLGTAEDTSQSVTLCINYELSDISTNLTEVDHTKRFYFHVTVDDESLYGKKLTIDYTTSVGYHDTKDIVLTADENTYALDYPSTSNANYSIDFKLLADDNSTLASQSVTVK